MPLLELCQIRKSFSPGSVALDDVSFEVRSGEDLVLLGQSGSGKSTLLRLIAGLDSPTTGEIRINGYPVWAESAASRGVAFLPQRPAFYPHLTMKQNLVEAGPAFPREAIDFLKISQHLDRYPSQLSGGELQRFALARLLVRPTSLWLLDEPFNGLDIALRQEFRLDLLLLKASANATILIVTHDPADALALACHIGVLGAGRLIQHGLKTEVFVAPKHLTVWQCLGLGSTLDGHAVGGEQAEFRSTCGAVRISLPNGWPKDLARPSQLTLGIRPEELLVELPDAGKPSELGSWQIGWPLILVEPVGRGWYLTLARGRTRVRVFDPSHAPPPVGCLVNWCLPLNAGTWFDCLSGLALPRSAPHH